MAYKHVGKMKNNSAKVLVAYRTLPGESDSALLVNVAKLSSAQHDSIMKVVESQQGQAENELGNILARSKFPDGRTMLQALHTNGQLVKVGTSEVIMTPATGSEIVLSELNQLIAEQKGVTVDQLAIGEEQPKAEVQEIAKVNEVKPSQETQQDNGVLTDDDLAKQYRSQADAMFKEAQRLRKQAEELSPTKKKVAAKKEETEVSAE